jgi:histidinol-phosphate aminotransferase
LNARLLKVLTAHVTDEQELELIMPDTRPSFTALAETLPSTVPFVGPEAIARQRGRAFAARLGANESGFGPSPRVIAAMQAAAEGTWAYGDPENHEIKAAVALHLAAGFNNVAVGGGIDGLFGLTVRLFAGPGDAVVSSLGGYPTFHYHVAGFGAALRTTPYVSDHEDLDRLLELARREKAKIVYLANPDNPMGTWHSGADVAAFARALPPETLLVLDEAYCETAPDGTLPDLPIDQPNVLRFRTFSKAYGLAGARLGYVFGDARLINGYDKVRNHFGISRITQAAGIAALKDQDYLRSVVTKIIAARDRITQIAGNAGLKPLPSATNFVAIDCGRDGAFAKAVLDGLIARDVFVRKPVAPVLDRCIRVSCGPDKELGLFEAALEETLYALR